MSVFWIGVAALCVAGLWAIKNWSINDLNKEE